MKRFFSARSTTLVLYGIFVCCQAKKDNGNDDFYEKYLNKYCNRAQGLIANTKLKAIIQVYPDLQSFIDSDAEPYVGAETLPLKVSQYVGDSMSVGYPTTVMCKMKSWDAIQVLFSTKSAKSGSNCSTVNKRIAKDVIGQIKKDNPRADVLDLSSIKFDSWMAYSGPQWTAHSPSVSAYLDTNGDLHIVGKELYVSQDNPAPIPVFKKGVDYCQTIAPAYLRDILLDKVGAPTCSSPPPYNPADPSGASTTWTCP